MKYSLGYSTILTVLSSLDVKLNGAFGNLTALQPRHSQQISTKIFGHGNTNSWLLGATDCYSTYTLVYELSSAKAFSKVTFILVRITIFNLLLIMLIIGAG